MRGRDELLHALAEQMDFLAQSSSSYDSGRRHEAKRLATVVQTLVHDRGRTQSLLSQLGIKDGMPFLSTAEPIDPNNLLPQQPLVGMSMGAGGVTFIPLCSLPPGAPHPVKDLKFEEWWSEPVVALQDKRTLTRQELVACLRDQDGGSHFDPALTHEVYRETKAGAGWRAGSGDELIPGLEYATMRHVAWELQQSIERAKIC